MHYALMVLLEGDSIVMTISWLGSSAENRIGSIGR